MIAGRRFLDLFLLGDPNAPPGGGLLGDPNAPPGGGLLGPAPRPPVPPGRVTRQQRRAAERKS